MPGRTAPSAGRPDTLSKMLKGEATFQLNLAVTSSN
jgi:hypothetical protein